MSRSFKIEGSGPVTGFVAYGTLKYVEDDQVVVDLDGPYKLDFTHGAVRSLTMTPGGMLLTSVGETDLLHVAREEFPVFVEEMAKFGCDLSRPD